MVNGVLIGFWLSKARKAGLTPKASKSPRDRDLPLQTSSVIGIQLTISHGFDKTALARHGFVPWAFSPPRSWSAMKLRRTMKQHAHQRGIIHRDLKPPDMLVTPYDGRPVPKVIDFGLAIALHQQLTEWTLIRLTKP